MQLAATFTEFAYSKDWSPSSRRWYACRLGAFNEWLTGEGITEVEGITAPLVRRYIEYKRHAPSQRYGKTLDSHTLHGHVRAIRALLNWAVKEELLSEKVVRRIELPKREQKLLAIFSPQHLDNLFAVCDRGETPEYVARDRAILAVLVDTGLRAAELCGLTLERVVFSQDDAYLILHGKGRKQREVGLGKKARQALHRYIHRYRPRTQDAHVFVGKGGAPLTTEGLDRLLYRLRDRAGIEGVRVSAHTFRHTFAVRYLEAGGDIYRLARIMGHSTVVVTEGYLKAFNARAARQGSSVLDAMRAS
jgi:site-specific recombinase XerD